MARRFIVEADGGSRGNPGPAGYGAVVVDRVTGEVLVETAEYIGTATNNVAEYRGLIAGLRAAYALDPDASVLVRMDAKLVVEQMSGRWKIKHEDMGPLAAEAKSVLPPSRVSYEWVPREQNKRADRLANEAMDAAGRGLPWRRRKPTGTDGGDTGTATPGPSGDGPSGTGPSGTATPGPSGTGLSDTGTSDRGTSDSGPSGKGPSGTGPSGGGSSGIGPGRGAGPADRAAETRTARTPRTTRTATTPAAMAARAAKTVPAAAVAGAAGAAAADLGVPTTFVLLRHGETPLTPEKRFSGSGGSDPDLSPVGRRQAELAAAALAARGTVQAVVSSPLLRCRRTAEAVAGRLGLDVLVDEGLRETDFGAWEGLTFAEVRGQYPADLDAWLALAKAAPTGGGESFAAVTRRVTLARDKLIARYTGRTVLLVTHVTPIKTLVRLALKAPWESAFRMELSAASLSEVAHYADGNASLRFLNDTSHLR
jgi:ribonuclease H / adenosylcobalamin/alpha-ribazole phosphatase